MQTAVAKHDPRARKVTKVDDFAYVKDATFLKAAFDLGLLDKGERDTLKEALDPPKQVRPPQRSTSRASTRLEGSSRTSSGSCSSSA